MYRDISLSATLVNLLRDLVTLEDDALLDLACDACREVEGQEDVTPHDRAVAQVAMILTGTLSDPDLDERCRALDDLHEDGSSWMVRDRKERRAWLRLVDDRFPQVPARAARIRARLLDMDPRHA